MATSLKRQIFLVLIIVSPVSLAGAFVFAPRLGRCSFVVGAAARDSSLGGVFYGGDFAGLTATFSAETGELLPVPDYLVPEALLEWGQAPSCLETIGSEELHDDSSLTRQILAVIPDVGCGVDNLDTIKTTETLSRLEIFDSVVAFDAPDRQSIETSFAIDNGQRLRVVINVEKGGIKSPITLILERQTSETSSGGTIADGGGLDGRSVSRLLGDGLKGTPFAEQKPVEWEHNEEKTQLNLPGNVTVSYHAESPTEWTLEVGHITNGASRRVVRRRFGNDCTMEGPIEHWVESRQDK